MSGAPAIKSIAPYFGCARLMAKEVGALLAGCKWVGIPFAGAMPELLYIDAPTIVVGDLHRHVINLARCLASVRRGSRLYRRLRRLPFCDEILRRSQQWCKENFTRPWPGALDDEAAYHYFVACWMNRSGTAGRQNEFTCHLPVRWKANGGDSNVRYRAAVRSIIAWRRILQRVNLVVQDCFDFLDNVQDAEGHAIYCDPPFPGPGAKYRHKFSEADHRKLAEVLNGFSRARCVCRFYDHPLIRELYPEPPWHWHHFTGRKQSNADAPEVLLTNGPSFAAAGQRELFE